VSTAVTKPQQLSCDENAAQIVADVVEETMAIAARAHAAEHGRELEDQVLIAFGGAAPLRAASLAEKLGIRKVLVPPDASVGSAIGFLSAPLAFEALRSQPMNLDTKFDFKEVNAIYRGLWHETVMVVAAGAARWKPGRPAKERRRAYGRYVGQGREVVIDLPNRDFTAEDAFLLRKSFEEAYEKLYFRIVPGAAVEILTWALEVVADADPLTWSKERLQDQRRQSTDSMADSDEAPAKRLRASAEQALFDAASNSHVMVPLYKRDELMSGHRVSGPAIISEKYTSTIVTSSFDCVVLDNGFFANGKQGPSPSISTT
jgi:N-methylhydantoinase A